MDEEVEKIVETVFEGSAVFIPSHLTKALVATGIAVASAGLSFVAGSYAMFEFKRVRVEEIAAMIKPPSA